MDLFMPCFGSLYPGALGFFFWGLTKELTYAYRMEYLGVTLQLEISIDEDLIE